MQGSLIRPRVNDHDSNVVRIPSLHRDCLPAGAGVAVRRPLLQRPLAPVKIRFTAGRPDDVLDADAAERMLGVGAHGPQDQLLQRRVGWVGRGEAAENRRKAEQFGIRFPVVLQEKWKLSKEYGIFATPVAFLVDEDGVLMQDVAVGAEAITALAREGLKARKDYESAFSA